MSNPTDSPLAERAAEWAGCLIEQRRTVLPKRLAAPGPGAQDLDRIFRAAAAAPDHGELVPWRFVMVEEAQRPRLAEVFARALLDRDPDAQAEQVEQARAKAFRAPLLMLAVVRTGAGDEVPAIERMISAGCAIQNMLLMATALGFGSALTSGKALQSARLRGLFGLGPGEEAACFVSIGTVTQQKARRARPEPERFVTTLGNR